MTDVIFAAERHDDSKWLPLRTAWVEGGNDDIEFSLECGAGLGSPLICLTVKAHGKTVTETIDIRGPLTDWVTRIADEIKAAA